MILLIKENKNKIIPVYQMIAKTLIKAIVYYQVIVCQLIIS
jgi:hypothetical protein